jgi:hypothetical protein
MSDAGFEFDAGGFDWPGYGAVSRRSTWPVEVNSAPGVRMSPVKRVWAAIEVNARPRQTQSFMNTRTLRGFT